MSENFRTGAGAASRPRIEDLIRERKGTTERAVGVDADGTLRHWIQPEDESPYVVTFVSYPLFSWTGRDVIYSDISNLTSAVYRPSSVNLDDPTFYSVFMRWPVTAGVNNLLGMFIRSRPIGSIQWREQTDYRPFTAEKDQYSPAKKNLPDSYVEELNPSVTDEYQIATRYSWTPSPGYEFLSDIRSGASFSRLHPVMVTDRVAFGSALPQRKNLSDTSGYYAIFGEVDLIDEGEYLRGASALGNSGNGEGTYWASFADTKAPEDAESSGNSTAVGTFKAHRGQTYFVYAEDATGIVVID